jgi:hypothetical protein
VSLDWTTVGTADAGQSVVVEDWGISSTAERNSIPFITHLLDTARLDLYTTQVACEVYK